MEFRTQRTGAARWLVVMGALCLAWHCGTVRAAEYRIDTTTGYQGTLLFEGVKLGDDLAQLKRQFPKASYRYNELDHRAGLECYVVGEPKVADDVQFVFCDDRLYQMQVSYSQSRIEANGDSDSLRKKICDALGPADHTDPAVHTWRRLGWRADLYTNSADDTAVLLVTDTNYLPIVEQRLRRLAPRGGLDTGVRRTVD